MTRVLFICAKNGLRSPTAEQVFASWPGVQADSAGINPDADVPLGPEQLRWADLIFVMERRHQSKLRKNFQAALAGTRVVVMGIPDDFAYVDPALVALLEARVGRYMPAHQASFSPGDNPGLRRMQPLLCQVPPLESASGRKESAMTSTQHLSNTLAIIRKLSVFAAFTWLAGALAVAFAGLSASPHYTDLILVLGNTVDSANRPLPSLTARLDAALALSQRDQHSFIMVSGGIDPEDGRDEARGMHQWLLERGTPADHIIMDPYGDNTRASAEHAKAWLVNKGLSRTVVVSQYFHIPRARLALSQAGVDDVGGEYPRQWFMRDIYSTLREVPGYLAYLMRIR